MQDAAAHYQVAIIGAGFGGLAMAIRLLQRNIHNFVILEKSNEVGGTWRENQYPGAACDVQSHLHEGILIFILFDLGLFNLGLSMSG